MEQTWVAYTWDEPVPTERAELALARVGWHYGQLVEYPIVRRGAAGERTGVFVWDDVEPCSSWPVWSEVEDVATATAYMPTGWQRVVGPLSGPDAPLPLARALLDDHERLAELDPPFLIGIFERATETLTILNDWVGAARLYEMRFEGGWVWSNRLGALPIFAGITPEADDRGWALLAAGGWFMSDSTPIRGATKVSPGSAIRVERSGVSRRTGTVGKLVEPRDAPFLEMAAASAEQARGVVRGVADVWAGRLDIDLSGGRDSRVTAAAALAEGVDAAFRTLDSYPGEAAIARRLAAASPHPMAHRVADPREKSVTEGLRPRASAMHLVHDGMRAPQGLRSMLRVPQTKTRSPTLSGYGGEIAHGFFYGKQRILERIQNHPQKGPLRRLEKFLRRKHDAGSERVYDIARAELERTLAEGRRHGLEGPPLLDYFYLVDRFPFKSGLGMNASTFSVFATPAFVRAAFDLSPDQRFEDLLHLEIIGRLVPEWREIPFHKRDQPSQMPSINRPRIWETDVETLGEMIGEESAWGDLFDADRVRTMFAEVQAGGGHSHYEQLFERLVWRVSYEDHLALLGRRGVEDPPRDAVEKVAVERR